MSSSSSSSSEKKEIPTVRRSGRKRVSTTVKIGGYDVKRSNNYTVTESSYEFATHVEDPAKNKKPRTEKKPKKPSAPRKQTEAEEKRQRHNEEIRLCVEAKKQYRESFLAKHKDVLAPFIDEATKENLEEWSKKKMPAAPYEKEELFEQPELVTGGEMRDYQLAGLNFMVDLHNQGIASILGDEMGLGKTLQTISFLAYLKSKHGEKCGPSLVVCPLSVLYSWCSEVERWAPSLKYLRLHSPNSEEQERQRLEVAQNGTSYDIIITTYEMVKVPPLMSIWRRLHFRLCVLDEGHKIKGIDTLNAQAVRKVHCENRLLLTGTPLQNNLAELVSLLNFLIPDIFTNFKPFDDAFDITNNRIDKQKMFEAQKILDILMIRRLKEQVEKLLPKKIETKVYCPMSKQQVFWYKNLLLKDIDTLARYEHGLTEETPSATAAKKLRNLMMQMRKATLHPFLFDGAEPDIEATTLQELVAASGKLAVLDSLLRSLFVKGNRVCLFSQFTTLLDIIEDYCTMRGWNMCRFDGSTSRAKRNYLINAFNAPNSPYFIFLMSTKSGGLGTNLQSADTVVLFDSDWNPQSDLQAIARCHRIGSKNTVHVYRLISGGTIEERIVQRAEKKLLLDQMVNRGKAAGVETEDDVVSKLSATELLKDIKFGSAAVFGDSSVNTLPSKKDIEFITDRTRTESDSAGNLKGNAYHKGDSFDANQELSATQTFAGVDFAKIREEYKKKQQQTLPETMKGIAHLWDEISQLDKKREKKNRVLMVKGNGSGYGSAYVPVLASNNYELTKGESSVFGRELSSKAKETYAVPKRNKDKVKLENQGWCQYCGDGGTIYLCSRCPIAVHKECCIRFLYPRLPTERRFFSCSHHWCTKCGKSAQHAGGILFPCQACPVAFCEDCLPKDRKGFRFLGQCDRFEELGFNSTKQNVYIHCSEHCENYAITEFGWTPPQKSNLKPACPAKLDVSYNFDTAEEPQVESLDNEDTEMSDSALTASMTTSTSSPSSETGSDREGTMEKNKVKGKAVRNRTRPESRVGAIASSVKGMLFGGR